LAENKLEIADLAEWIDVRFDRASGPGGQHVNKVSTRVSLCFDFAACPLLRADVKERLRARNERRLDAQGRLRIVSQDSRSQTANRADAEARLLELIEAAVVVPRKRRQTKPSRGARERRLREKRVRGEIKRQRSRPVRGQD